MKFEYQTNDKGLKYAVRFNGGEWVVVRKVLFRQLRVLCELFEIPLEEYNHGR